MSTLDFYNLAAVLALLVLANTGNLVVGVLAIVTGKSYYPRLIQRLARRWTPASPEDRRMWGMGVVLSSVAGLVLALQLGLLLVFMSTGFTALQPPAFLFRTMATIYLMFFMLTFFVEVLLLGASLALHLRIRYVDGRPNRPSGEANFGPLPT
jgi:hypothetical protein